MYAIRSYYASLPSEALRLTADTDQIELVTRRTTIGELIQAIVPVRVRYEREQTWFLITSLLLPSAQLETMQTISDGITGYQQMIMLKAPIKFSLIIMLFV